MKANLNHLVEDALASGTQVAVPDSIREWLKVPKHNLIAGDWVSGPKPFQTFAPATGEVLAVVAEAGKEEVHRAVTLARKVFEDGSWSGKTIGERAKVLRAVAEIIRSHLAELAIIESLDTGKPIRESFEGDMPRAAANFEFFADFASSGEESLKNGNETHTYFREPLGVVALVTPWNLPLYLETWKLAPALAMGNSCLLKPSELTPLSATYFGELVKDLFPPGVFQILHGFGENSAGEFLVSHAQVDAISFTGETGTGRAIMKAAATGPRRVSFELGGKGASIVFADADREVALTETLRAAFRNQGEICLASPRIYVEESICNDFIEDFAARSGDIVVGDPLNGKTQMGAVISLEHREKIEGYLKKVSRENIVAGGRRPKEFPSGFFLEPTVLVGVAQSHAVTQEEIFGPVVAIYPFKTEDEAINAVNGTPYGLSASVYTKDIKKGERVARRIHAGLVWINCWFVRDFRVPFGGQKKSGVGREGGKHSLDFFSEWKSVCVRQG